MTEMITGIDIVRQQLLIASGEPLEYKQEDIKFNGHAIECRVNAEDPRNFLPCPGQVTHYHAPGGKGVRVDSHLYSGYRVPPYYDSMVGKVITHGRSREIALNRMDNALIEIVVEGIKTNIPLHVDLINDPAFREGGQSIHYLEKKLDLMKG